MKTSLACAALGLLSFAGSAACANLAWNKPIEPYKVAGNIYYVGTNYLASFLFTTPQGHILLNSDYEESVPVIRASVEKLGFKFTDIKYIISSHAHDDHAAGNFLMKELTGAKTAVMDSDVEVMQSGGESDFAYGGKVLFHPSKPDVVLHDGDKITLGGFSLTAHKTPGHTKGCTTWTTVVDEGGRKLNVVIVGSVNVNPGFRLVNNAKYPNIAEDYGKSFRVLHSLPCDLFLGAHGVYYNMDAKLAAWREHPDVNPFIDPEGYKRFVDEREQAFRTELAKQKAAAK